jgi:hypothetical protein
MSIDRGDSHFDDAGNWEQACRHIGLFLWWAANRGLASEEHGPDAMAENPTEYFIANCDTKLWRDDFNDEGNAFAEAEYDAYLGAVSAYARSIGVGDYEIPTDRATTDHFFAWLDRRLDAWRAAKRSS